MGKVANDPPSPDLDLPGRGDTAIPDGRPMSVAKVLALPASSGAKIATVSMPMRRAVLMTRQAISPRLAMSILCKTVG